MKLFLFVLIILCFSLVQTDLFMFLDGGLKKTSIQQHAKSSQLTIIKKSSQQHMKPIIRVGENNLVPYSQQDVLGNNQSLVDLEYMLLTGENEGERIYALIVLEKFKSKEALNIISKALGDENTLVRSQVIEILSRINLKETTPFLGQILFNEPELDLKLQAMDVLAKQNSPASKSILQYFSVSTSDMALRNHSRDLLTHMSDNIRADINKEEEDYYSTMESVYFLSSEERIDKIQRILKNSDDASLREEAVLSLSYSNEKSVIPIIESALRDRSNNVRFQALQTLTTIGTPSLSILGQVIFGDPDPKLRAEAIDLIAMENTPASRALLEQALNDTNDEIRTLVHKYLEVNK